MTQQIGRAYRRNRRRSWLLIAAVVAIAAAAIPIASGAAEKNYTLLFPSTGAAVPTAKAGSTTNQTLCVGSSYTVTLTLTNTAKTVNLGSANITFPTNVTLSGTPGIASASSGYTLPTTARATLSGRTVSLRELSMPKDKAVMLTVQLNTNASTSGALAFNAAVKQSNDFNDTGGSANTFSNPTFPTLTLETCVTTIDGRVFLDKNLDGDYDFTAPADASDDIGLGWSVTLYRTSPAGLEASTSSLATDGTYHFGNVPTGRDYKVCVNAPAGTTWQQTKPTGTTVCSTMPSVGIPLTNLQTAQTSPAMDFGNVATVDPSCSTSFSGTTLSGTTAEYQAKLHSPDGGPTCKVGDLVMYTYKSGTELFATLHPTAVGTKFKVVEHIRWEGLAGHAQNPVTLVYDDIAPYDGVDKRTMLLCKKDPRPDPVGFPFDLASGPLPTLDAEVLPAGETTCMIESTDAAGSTGATFDAWIYSNVDGYRGDG